MKVNDGGGGEGEKEYKRMIKEKELKWSSRG